VARQKKPVTILTMMHDNNGMMDQERQAGKWEPVKKPKPVLDYNKCMGDGQNGPTAYILHAAI
jgi:hypothetical protein